MQKCSDQWNGIESPETVSNICKNIVYDKGDISK